MRAPILPLALALVITAACGGSSSTDIANPDSGSPPGATPGSKTADGGSQGTPPGATPPPPPTSLTFGTYIALGDSISDRGGEAPFFYDLLLTNDDAAYPAWKGHDLSTRYKGIKYEHLAQGGAITDAYDDIKNAMIPTLAGQIAKLGHEYPGDVLITLTIGGNDLNFHAANAIQGIDKENKAAFTDHLKKELAEITAPGRLGSGRVVIVQANIYDATDGQGNWKVGRCGPNFDVGKESDNTVFDSWNEIIAKSAADVGPERDIPFDLHALFKGHGFNSSDDWFMPDCLHPTKKGHNQIRREIWHLLTGETIGE